VAEQLWFVTRIRKEELKMAEFDRSYETSYQSATVAVASSFNIFEIFDVEEYRDLKI